jgi:hypothetical protein
MTYFSKLRSELLEAQYVALDSWFELDEIIENGRGVLILRGRTKMHDKKVVLKCSICAAYTEDAFSFTRGDLLAYEGMVYEHAVEKLEHFSLYVRFVARKSRKWSFLSFEEISSENMRECDQLLLRWMQQFTFDSVEDFNYGANITVMEDCGKKCFRTFFPMSKLSACTFVVQTVAALEQMSEIGLVHGDLRWNNILFPRRKCYFDLRQKLIVDKQEDENTVPVDNLIKIFDWDHAYFSGMPFHGEKSVYESYHTSARTNMNDIYDKLGFLRLLYLSFPGIFMHDEDVASLQPAFFEYVYRDPHEGTRLSQISQKGKGEPTWPDISILRSAVNQTLHKVYISACSIMLAHRNNTSRANFCLAVEGDNSAKMKTMLQYPFFLDLNKEVIKASAAISAERVMHDPDDAFHNGWLTTVFEDVILGFAMMGFECNFSEAKMEAFKRLLQHPNSTTIPEKLPLYKNKNAFN